MYTRAEVIYCIAGPPAVVDDLHDPLNKAGVNAYDTRDVCMPYKKTKQDLSNATRASVQKETAMPRMARSAKIAELNLDTARIWEQPSTTLLGTVDEIILSPHPTLPEMAQIAVDGPDRGYRDFRIEDTLTDEHGDDVKLKTGAHVDVTVTAEPKT